MIGFEPSEEQALLIIETVRQLAQNEIRPDRRGARPGDTATTLAMLSPGLLGLPAAQSEVKSLLNGLLPSRAGDRFVPGSLAIVDPRFDFDVVHAPDDGEGGRGRDRPRWREVPGAVARGDGPAITKGMALIGCEKKLGIRASDTATLRFEDGRVPAENLLGSSEVEKKDPRKSTADTKDRGFKGAMATFDASRPIVAARATGIGRAALDFLEEELERQGLEIRDDAPARALTAIEPDLIEREAELRAARLLTWRAAWIMNSGKPSALEASMAKAKAGLAVTKITWKAVQLLGPVGYSKRLLVEWWMRDAKINDVYEGTRQIDQLIVARRSLDYPSAMLR